jgi:hypothetical protein
MPQWSVSTLYPYSLEWLPDSTTPPPLILYITPLITSLKISLIFLLMAIPEISKPSNWSHALAIVCARGGVTNRAMAVYYEGRIVLGSV